MDSKELRNLQEAYKEVYVPQEEIDEATYSAKAARAGKDIGKPGKQFTKIAKEAGKRYGSKERGEKVAGAVLAKLRKQHEEVEIDEAVKGASRHDTEMRKASAAERKAGIKNRLSPAAGKDNADKMQRDVKFFDKLTKKNKNVVGLVAKEEVDIFDTILEYLIAEGYADTNENAIAIMANMSEEWRQSIVEVKMDPRGRPASGPMNVYANPKGKPDPAHLDAVKAYDEKQKKKTPEQRKAELDAYRERQMNNK